MGRAYPTTPNVNPLNPSDDASVCRRANPPPLLFFLRRKRDWVNPKPSRNQRGQRSTAMPSAKELCMEGVRQQELSKPLESPCVEQLTGRLVW